MRNSCLSQCTHSQLMVLVMFRLDLICVGGNPEAHHRPRHLRQLSIDAEWKSIPVLSTVIFQNRDIY